MAGGDENERGEGVRNFKILRIKTGPHNNENYF